MSDLPVGGPRRVVRRPPADQPSAREQADAELAAKIATPNFKSAPTKAHFVEDGGKAARAAAEAGMERVAKRSPEWTSNALRLIPGYPHAEATGEDIRLWLAPQIGEPPHHNMTGSMIRNAVRNKLLEPTGEWRGCETKASHSRKAPVYRLTR